MSSKGTSFDWRAIHKELEGRLSHLGGSVEDNAGRVQELLRTRTVQLAAVPREGRREGLGRVIVLTIGEERYGLAAECAQEVTKASSLAILPDVGEAVLGIANWRGEFVTVFDLPRILEMAPDAEDDRGFLVVLRGEEPRMALAVDGVDHIAEVDFSHLQPADQLQVRHAELFRGAAADGLLVLDETKLLTGLQEDLQAA